MNKLFSAMKYFCIAIGILENQEIRKVVSHDLPPPLGVYAACDRSLTGQNSPQRWTLLVKQAAEVA